MATLIELSVASGMLENAVHRVTQSVAQVVEDVNVANSTKQFLIVLTDAETDKAISVDARTVVDIKEE